MYLKNKNKNTKNIHIILSCAVKLEQLIVCRILSEEECSLRLTASPKDDTRLHSRERRQAHKNRNRLCSVDADFMNLGMVPLGCDATGLLFSKYSQPWLRHMTSSQLLTFPV